MRRSLLKKQPTWGLRRAQGTGQKSATPATLTKVLLVLLTMLLLPSTAWGQGEYISSTFSGINLGQGEGSGPIYYNSATATTSTTDASTPRIEQGSTATGWDVKGMNSSPGSLAAEQGSNKFYFRPNNTGQETIVKFNLESQFGINGKFVKAEIIYSYSYIKSIKADATKIVDASNIALANSDISFTCSESGTAEGTTGTITANVSDYSNMVFANNKIDLSFTVTTAAVQSGIPSFTISEIRLYFEDVTEQPFNIWVNGTSLTDQNITTFLDGKLGYTQPDGNKPAILHLKGTTAIQSIYTTLENLEIHLSGENKITPSSQVANGICSSQSRDEGTLTFTTEEGGSLTIATGVSVIRGFGYCNGNIETQAPYQVTNWLTPSGSYYYLLDSRHPENDSLSIKWIRITEAQTYPLWVTEKQVTANNEGNVLGDNKVSFTPNNNTLTLKSADITVNGKNAIVSGLANLTVNLINLDGVESVITCQGNTDRVFKGIQSGANVTFTTDATTPGSLGGSVKQESESESYMFDGIAPIYQNGLNYWREGDSFSIDTRCGIKIGDVAISSANVGSNGTITGVAGIKSGTVKFTPADNTTTPATPATLTLTNATLGGSTTDGSIESILDNLTINLEGTNTLYGHIAYTGTGATAGSLAFTGNGSLTLSNSDGVIYAFSDVDFEEFNFASISQGIHYNTSTKNLQDANEYIVSNVTIIKGTYYPIWVKGTLVTASNYSDVLDDGKVSFDPTGNKLSLDEATIDCSETSGVVPVASTIKDLKVYLSGINTIKVYPYSNEAFVYAGSESGATLTFSTVDPSDYENLGMLTIEGIGSKDDISSGYAVKGLVGETSTAIANWKEDTSSTPDRSVSGWKYLVNTGSEPFVKLSYREVYDLWISYSRYCSDNLTLTGETFNPTTSTLTFNGISGSTYQIYSGLDDLTIKIGSKTQLKAITFGAPNDETIGATSGKLTIMKNETSTAAVNKLTLANDDTDGGVISGFSSVTIKEPMGVKTPSPFTTWGGTIHEAVISDEIFYDLWVMGQRVTSANASDIFGAAQSSQPIVATFDAEESTLTLNGLQLSNSITYPTCIESGLEDLTVSLSGENKFQKGGDVTTLYGFKAQDGKTCNITFEASGSFSFMVQTEPEYAVSGFNKVTYKDNLIAYKKDGKTYISTLRLQFGADNTDNPTAITISPVQEGVELFSHKIAYEINYAKDGIDNIAQTEYTAAIPISTISAGPCIVSAYTIDGDNTKSNATKSYYFIYSESELIIGTGSTLDLRDYLLPSIAEEDNWLCDHTTGNTDIISIESQNGIITGLADGTATVTTQIIDGNEEYSVLNYYISQLSIDVTVQDIIGESTFASGQSYGTFYNTDQAYNVPEGLEAYIIKSVDEEKGEIVTEKTSVLPPNTPVLLYRTSTSGSANYVFTKVSGVERANTVLQYTTTEKEAVETSKLYVLYNGQFVKVTANTMIPANHCYLDLATTAGTRGFYNIGGGEGTTSLREVKTDGVNNEKWTDGEWYTLQGQRVAKPAKGLYILNGKKVVVK